MPNNKSFLDPKRKEITLPKTGRSCILFLEQIAHFEKTKKFPVTFITSDDIENNNIVVQFPIATSEVIAEIHTYINANV